MHFMNEDWNPFGTPPRKATGEKETKQQRMWECQRRVDRNALPHAADTSAVPGAAALQSESSEQNKKSMTTKTSFVGNYQMLQLQTWLQSGWKPDHLTQQSLF